MPSAYVLAKDHIEQARAMISNEVWYDRETDILLERAITRLVALDRQVYDHAPQPVRPVALTPPQDPPSILPWLRP